MAERRYKVAFQRSLQGVPGATEADPRAGRRGAQRTEHQPALGGLEVQEAPRQGQSLPRSHIGAEIVLRSFNIRSISFGSDAMGEATVEAEWNGTEHSGRGTSTDFLEASALAWLDVANRLLKARARAAAAVVEEAGV